MNPHREALFAARFEVEKGEEYICYALRNVARLHSHLADAAKALQERVNRELAPRRTLGVWLHAQGVYTTHRETHMARLAWIDRMLEDYP